MGEHFTSQNCQNTQKKTNQPPTFIYVNIFEKKNLHLAVMFKKDFYDFKGKVVKVYTI